MRIYIIRHGIAEDVAKGGGGDAKRALTQEGRKKMKEAADGFARLEPKLDRIFASPLVRARQTAEIIAEPLKKDVEEMKELSPGFQPVDVMNALKKISREESVALTGHEPNCSELCAYLLCPADGMSMEFKKGAICLIEIHNLEASSGTLLWHLPPAALRLMVK
jgi:phosphohistidine phosphatase